ncbi:putative metalloprotease CJM1_0395 family protein [Allochromatium vinosum]|uniref:SrpA-related protein n=1 Tax=Allochromatium vinosum (strain ATCC 17899 / DSM 180 / NBRC 103801 / NCIMB 10441 / D) TaxID=572477 RepID=D3RTJ5_ALLVD|nr:putative metalloprotease CJM1_0395 family protein [Allochromatium vinosum]ADC62504.1 hypothetical protein Alvin_1571 [Allochromatium vinosum DSM 180]
MSASGSQAAAALARDEPVEDPRAIEETSRIEAERATGEDDPTAAKGVNGETLSDEDQLLVEQLKQRDAEVRAHEQAHVSAGGGHITSGPSYSYQSGPDGRRYAIGGEVGIDTSMKAGDPDGNLAKSRAIIRAAMAPAEPSSQDVRVAASARAMESQALQEIRELQVKEYEQVMSTTGSTDRSPTSTGATTAQTASTAENGEAGSESAAPQNPGVSSGQARLAQRIAALFSAPVETGLSQLA